MERTFNLRVSSPDGKRVPVTVEAINGKVKVKVPYIKAVEDDGDITGFSKKGVIAFTVDQPEYQMAKEKTTKYLEDLFIKELSKDGDIHPSTGGTSNPRGTKGKPTVGGNEKA